MRQIAQVFFQGGGCVLPAREPYDQQLVFDHVRRCAERYGRVRLEVAGQTVWARNGEPCSHLCGECGRELRAISYTLGPQILCDRCVRNAVGRNRLNGGSRSRWWRRQRVSAA